jgi:two-component system chemotaxis sensor kinase CheA
MPPNDAPARLVRLFLGELDERLSAFDSDLLAFESNPPEPERSAILQRLFRGAHSLKGAAASIDALAIGVLCQRLEDTLAALRDGTLAADAALIESLFAASDALREAGRQLETGAPQPAHVLDVAVQLEHPPQHPSQRSPEPPRAAHDYTMRVDAERIDALLEQSSDLLVAQHRLHELHRDLAAAGETLQAVLRRRPDEELREVRRALDRAASTLRDDGRLLRRTATDIEAGLRAIRTLPFGSALEGLERVVRDAAKATGKRAVLEIEGAGVGVDRAILERLRDPLVHLVRNAIDHGIEAPHAREALGKPPAGTIRLAARPKGGQFEVIVSDDGRGFDLEALRRRAQERGIALDPADDVARAAFLPGLSTAAAVTSLSGRGVGLDVVRTEVEALGGTVNVTSVPNAGTQFLFALPLTLTSIRSVLCAVAGQAFGIGVTAIERVVRLDAERTSTVEGRPVLLTGEAPLPLIPLRTVLGLDEPAGDGREGVAIVVRNRNRAVALSVDALLDELQVNYRTLGPRLHALPHVAGASIAADGSIVLMLRSSTVIEAALALARTLRVAAPAPATLAPAAPKRVLLVDDSITTRALERSILEAAGFNVVTAADGRAAWELLNEHPVDLVVSDVDMPSMDGFALVEAIRGSAEMRALPIILVTARENEADRRRGLDAGADAYIVKSTFRQEELLDAIGALA